MEKNDKKKQYLADFGLFLVAAVWGGGFIAVKDALDTMSPFLLMAYRFTIAAAIVYVFFKRKMGKITKKDFIGGFYVGAILFIAFAFQTVGLKYTTASKQGFLTAVYCVLVPIIYWIVYKEMPKFKVFIGSILTIIGIYLVSMHEAISFSLGDGLTLICAVFFAIHILLLEYYTKKIDVFKLTFLQLAIAALFGLIFSFIFEVPRINVSSKEMFAIMYLAFFSTFICYVLQTLCQKYTPSSHASIIMSLESVFAAVFGVVLLNEVMTPLMVIGCAIIFLAILITELDFNMFKKKRG